MVGKFQGRFNLDNNGSALDGFNKETTIATRLHRAGYVTAQFGKWHLGPQSEITKHGFKHVYSQHGQQKFPANITVDGQDQPMSEMKPELYHVDGCTRAAAAIVTRYKEQPFFLYIAHSSCKLNLKRAAPDNTMLQKLFVLTLIFFGLNILGGILPEYGKSGGWDYSPEEAQRDCAEYHRYAKVYHIDKLHRHYFECIK